MIELTAQLRCDRCKKTYGELLEFNDDDTNVSRVLDDKRHEARNDGWEVVRTKSGDLKDWCSGCMEKHFAGMQGQPTP